MLQGKRALVVGVANARSIAWGIADRWRREGAEVFVTYRVCVCVCACVAKPWCITIGCPLDLNCLRGAWLPCFAASGALGDAVDCKLCRGRNTICAKLRVASSSVRSNFACFLKSSVCRHMPTFLLSNWIMFLPRVYDGTTLI